MTEELKPEIITKKGDYLQVPGGKIWYETVGLPSKTNPLITVHGGPGYPRYLNPLADMVTQYGRPLVFYDQLGCGDSDRPDNKSLWTVDRSVEELDRVIKEIKDKFGSEKVHLLGQSYGGSVVGQYLIERGSEGISSATLASPLLNSEIFDRDMQRRIDQLPDPKGFREDVEAFTRTMEEGTPEHERLLEREEEFEAPFVYGDAKDHPAVAEAYENFGYEVYKHTQGGTEFLLLKGSLRDFDLLPRVGKIKIPVLFTGGANDEVFPDTLYEFQKLIPGSQVIIYQNSAHMAHISEQAKYMNDLESFLRGSENNQG